MSGSLATINIKFLADLEQFSTQMQSAVRQLDKHGKKLEKKGKQLSTYLTAPLLALAAVSTKNFDTQAKAIAQLEAGLNSTGNAVGYTSEQLQKMASELQNNSLFGDEQILKGATSQLLTFTNIAGEQFARTQQAALDLATRLDGDLKSASIQLGKALNDPIANLSALSRSGIQFTEDQKATIKSLAETNRLADAQTLILDELAKQYGGSAKAAAAAGAGGWTQFMNIVGDIAEEFGKLIIDYLEPMREKLKQMAIAFQELSTPVKNTILIIGSLAAAIGPLLITAGFLMTTVVPGLISAFSVLASTVIPAVISAVSFLYGELLVLQALILANPWTALATAIAAVTLVIYANRKEAEKTVKTISVLNQARKEASKATLEETIKVRDLINTARAEYLSKTKRLEAIKKLKQIAPSYFGDLTLETVKQDNVTTAVNNYIAALNRKAVAQAVQGKKEKLFAEILEQEQKSTDEVVQKSIDEYSKQFQFQNAQTEQQIKNFTALAKAGQEFSKSEIARIQSEITELDKYIDKYGQIQQVVTTPGTTPFNAPETKATGVGVVNTDTAITGASFTDPSAEVGASFTENLPELKDEYITYLQDLQAATNDFNAGFQSSWQQAGVSFAEGFGAILGGLANGTASFKDIGNLFLTTIADMAINVGKMAISMGLAVSGIKKALTSLNPAAAIGAGIALVAIGSAVKGGLSSAASVGSSVGSSVADVATGSSSVRYTPTNTGNVVAQKEEIGFVAETKLKGNDIAIVVSRVNKTNSRIG